MKKILLIIFLATIFMSCTAEKKDEISSASTSVSETGKEAVPVFIQKAVEEPFYTSINASGIIEGIREADVVSETSGLITEVFFDIGDYVEEGDVLLKVEDRMAALSYQSARQDFESARIEFEALEKSYKTGGTSQLLFSQGKAKLESARLRMEQAGDSYGNKSIRAPFNGYISIRNMGISEGNYLQTSAVVTHIVDNSSFRIRLNLGEDEIPLIQKGDKARIILNSLPELRIEAEVDAVSPGSSRIGGGFPVFLSWVDESEGRVKSGMSATVRIKPDKAGRNELIIPSSSVVKRDGRNYVFKVREDRAEAVEVRIVQSLGNRSSITDVPGADLSVEPGDYLIITGLNSLIPGDPVISTIIEDSL